MSSDSVTLLLSQLRGGDRSAFDALLPLVYHHLRRMASRYMSSERDGHTLPATALVHEAYLRLAGSDGDWENRAHFYAVAARVMRHILLDHAKANHREKRGGAQARVPLDEAVMVAADPPAGIIELDEALQHLARRDQRKSDAGRIALFRRYDLRRNRGSARHLAGNGPP